MPGDDIRRIDWRLYGRVDRYYIKEYEADTNTNFNVLLDVSKSMSFGSGTVTKLDYARTLAACLAYFSNQQRDRVGLITLDEDVVEIVPPSAKHLPNVLHALARATPQRAGNIERVFRKLAEQFKRRSMLLVISDFYEDPRKILDAFAQLRGRGNDIMAMHVLDTAELEFPYDGATSFEDIETGERIPGDSGISARPVPHDDPRAHRRDRAALRRSGRRLPAVRHVDAARPRVVRVPFAASVPDAGAVMSFLAPLFLRRARRPRRSDPRAPHAQGAEGRRRLPVADVPESHPVSGGAPPTYPALAAVRAPLPRADPARARIRSAVPQPSLPPRRPSAVARGA